MPNMHAQEVKADGTPVSASNDESAQEALLLQRIASAFHSADEQALRSLLRPDEETFLP